MSVTTCTPRVGERVGEPVGVARCEQHVADRGQHADLVLLRPALDQAEQSLLRAERVDGGGAALRDPEDPPVAARTLHGGGGVDRLVRAVEGADAEVDDPDGGPFGGQRRPGLAPGQPQGGRLQARQPARRHEPTVDSGRSSFATFGLLTSAS